MDTATSNGKSSQMSSFFNLFYQVPFVGVHSSLPSLSPTLNASFVSTQDEHPTNSTIIIDNSTILLPELDTKVNSAYVLWCNNYSNVFES